MSSLIVVVMDILGNFPTASLEIFIETDLQLSFDGSEAGFDKGIVIAIVGATHALSHGGAFEDGPIFVAGILSAAIGVVDQCRRRLAAGDGQFQGGQD